MTTTYRVDARLWEHGYELAIEGLGVCTQSLTLLDAEPMVRDWLELEGYADAATAEIILTSRGRALDDQVCVKCSRPVYTDNADLVGQIFEGTVISECWHLRDDEDSPDYVYCPPLEGIDKHWSIDSGGQYLHHP